jgi:hypothetical protein
MEEGRDLTSLHDGVYNVATGEDENNVEYVPAWIKGGVPHPGHVVQSTAMAVTEPPPITYRIRLPRRLIESGALSLLQVEAALYCMQMHEKRLPTGERAGWMLGDGTGIGKGRILSAIMYENLLRGRDRAVWVTASPFLANQIRRDVKDIGLPMRVLELKDQPLPYNPNLFRLGPGIMICTYRTLIRTEKAGNISRMGQLISWLGGENWDGVLALDDAGLLPRRVRDGVEEGRIPFGTLLAEAGIAFVSRPGTLFAVAADAALRGWLEIGAAWEGPLHGRTARLRDGAGRPLARVLEILSPALQPVGSALRR